jgi:hypothetical protein
MTAIENQQAKSFWLDHIQQWDQSELSQAAYCRQHDLCEQKFSYRKRQSGFAQVPVTVNSSTGFTRVQVESSFVSDQSSAADRGLSIRFSNGIRIEGIAENNLALISPLLTVLR